MGGGGKPDLLTLDEREKRKRGRVKTIKVPREPFKWQREEHIAKGHVEFQDWCAHCVRGRGQNSPHKIEEDRGREFPTVGIDYMWMGDDDEEIGMPPLTMTERAAPAVSTNH